MRKAILLILSAITVLAMTAQERLSLSNEECRRMALESSEDMKIAGNAIEGADIDRSVARTAYLPNLSGSATAVYMPRNTDMMGMEMVMKGTYMAGLNITQPIYAGGKIIASNKLSGIQQKVTAQQMRQTTMQTIADADNAYWTYLAVLNKVKMMQAYMVQMDSLYNFTSQRRDVGMITSTDLLRIEARRSEIRYQLEKCVNGADICRMSLCRIIGVDNNTAIIPTDTVIDIAQPCDLGYDLAVRPEMQLLELNIEAGKQMVNLTRGDFLPTIGVSLGYSHYGNLKLEGMSQTDAGPVAFKQTYSGNSTMAMLSVQVPLFHWGEGYKKVKRARLNVETARLELEKNRRLLDLEVRQAISNLLSGYSMTESAHTALAQAEANLEAVRDRYSVNMVTLTDLLDAESQWQQSCSNDIEARAQYRIYMTEYLRVTAKL